jgi:hypothetical protein
LLLLLANYGKDGRPGPIVGQFSQETLAETDRHNPSPRELFHEQIPQIGFYREHGFARQARDQNEELGSPFQMPVTSMNRASGWPSNCGSPRALPKILSYNRRAVGNDLKKDIPRQEWQEIMQAHYTQAHAFVSCPTRTQLASLKTPTLRHCTASGVLSVVCATENF